MYLAKFFHRTPGDDDRELLLIPGGDPIVIGIHMDEKRETPRDDFLREDFSDIALAVSAFRRHAAELVAAGYMETTHTRYTLRHLADPQPKPAWQKGLDDSIAGSPQRATRRTGEISRRAPGNAGRTRTALSLARRPPRLCRRR